MLCTWTITILRCSAHRNKSRAVSITSMSRNNAAIRWIPPTTTSASVMISTRTSLLARINKTLLTRTSTITSIRLTRKQGCMLLGRAWSKLTTCSRWRMIKPLRRKTKRKGSSAHPPNSPQRSFRSSKPRKNPNQTYLRIEEIETTPPETHKKLLLS